MVSKGGCAIMSNIENNENEILSFEELRKKLGMDEAPVKKTSPKDDFSSLQKEIETKPVEKKQVSPVISDITADIEKQIEAQVEEEKNATNPNQALVNALVDFNTYFGDMYAYYVEKCEALFSAANGARITCGSFFPPKMEEMVHASSIPSAVQTVTSSPILARRDTDK